MEFILRFLKKIIPQPIFKFLQPAYHWLLGFLAALFYGFPSRKLTVIGVTGTKGKTTTCNLIAQILNSAGFKTGMTTTVNFRIGSREWINTGKQTMLGRFRLQKLLAEMVGAGCHYAVVETSSEGILQYRHRFIDYKIAVFTNLTPEHIERHGGFENYRDAKLKLFKQVAKKPNAIGIYNLDDKNVGYFLKPKINRQYVYTLQLPDSRTKINNLHIVSNIKSSAKGTNFLFSACARGGCASGGDKEKFEMPLIGEMNVYNAAAAICVAISQGIPRRQIKKALAKAVPPPGRLELVNAGQKFTVIIDYSYEPASLENALKTIKVFKPKRIILVVGSAGGGRDKWRRPVMGELADKYANLIVITTDDPYDENPETITKEILAGVLKNKKRILGKNVFKITDRRLAIKKAIGLAKKGDVVLLAGKGGEMWMNVAGNKKIPWDEKKIAEEIIKAKS